jgi:hypothetical protein
VAELRTATLRPSPLAAFSAGQRRHVGLVEGIEQAVQLGPGVGDIERGAVGTCGDRETVRHMHAQRRELLEQLAQRGVLAADQGNVGQRQFTKPADVADGGHDGLPNAGR